MRLIQMLRLFRYGVFKRAIQRMQLGRHVVERQESWPSSFGSAVSGAGVSNCPRSMRSLAATRLFSGNTTSGGGGCVAG